jgi:hypothetical protein
MVKQLLVLALLSTSFSLAACKQELPSKIEQDGVFGTLQDLKLQDNTKMLIYVQGDDPTKKNWGLAGGYYVTVDGKSYMLHWDQADKFKSLKVGDKVNLHPSEYISCVGEADLKPTCYRMMRVYKSERRVDPLQTH